MRGRRGAQGADPVPATAVRRPAAGRHSRRVQQGHPGRPRRRDPPGPGPQLPALRHAAQVQLRLPDRRQLESQTGSWVPFTMRVDRPPFDDVRVRQAFRLVVDREQMIKQVLGGHGTASNDIYTIPPQWTDVGVAEPAPPGSRPGGPADLGARWGFRPQEHLGAGGRSAAARRAPAGHRRALPGPAQRRRAAARGDHACPGHPARGADLRRDHLRAGREDAIALRRCIRRW